jgi:N6-L-threonylcarbamoyladenine synthase
VDGLAVTCRPGLIGSLLVGVSYAKGLALATGKPLVAVDHIRAHVYSPHMERDIGYPYIALLLSGGHTLVIDVQGLDRWEVLGATVDDACGEAFDKIAKYFDIGFPGGVAIERLAERGHPGAYRFPVPSVRTGGNRFDVSYSGLKTAVIHQREQFRVDPSGPERVADVAASFQKTAIDIVVDQAIAAARSRGRRRIVAAGGVAANGYLRRRLAAEAEFETSFPSMALCTDNAAMIAGLGYQLLARGERSGLEVNARARVGEFRARYP